MSYDYKGIVRYEPETGLFRWLRSSRGGARPGKIAGTHNRGYASLSFSTDTGLEVWQAHRLAWLIMIGSLPTQIDHRNGIKDDNRWCNLRIATPRQNRLNPNDKIMSNNTSGCKGVHFERDRRKWRASVSIDGKRVLVGRFNLKADAITAREKAMEPLWFSP